MKTENESEEDYRERMDEHLQRAARCAFRAANVMILFSVALILWTWVYVQIFPYSK